MTRLTDSDSRIMAQAAQFLERNGIAEIGEDNGKPDAIAALVTKVGKARYLIGELTAMVRRLDEDGSDE